MKKGLRRAHSSRVLSVIISDHRPDEEGIKTPTGTPIRPGDGFQTTDLMKKGLRPAAIRPAPPAIRFQTTDLMKKGLRPNCPAIGAPRSFQTTDLMKKGLRPKSPVARSS